MDMAAAYIGIEAPEVHLDRDFDTQILDAQQITQYLSLWQQGAITHETLLEMLKAGECLPNIDVEREVELVELEKANNMEMAGFGSPAAVENAEEEEEEDEEELQQEQQERRQRESEAT